MRTNEFRNEDSKPLYGVKLKSDHLVDDVSKAENEVIKFKQKHNFKFDDVFPIIEKIRNIDNYSMYAHEYVLVDDGTIYETNELLTHDYGLNSEGYEYYFENGNLYETITYIDYESIDYFEYYYDSSPVYNTSEKECKGKIIMVANNLEDFLEAFDSPDAYIQKGNRKNSFVIHNVDLKSKEKK